MGDHAGAASRQGGQIVRQADRLCTRQVCDRLWHTVTRPGGVPYFLTAGMAFAPEAGSPTPQQDSSRPIIKERPMQGKESRRTHVPSVPPDTLVSTAYQMMTLRGVTVRWQSHSTARPLLYVLTEGSDGAVELGEVRGQRRKATRGARQGLLQHYGSYQRAEKRGTPTNALTITHIDCLSVWPHANPRPATPSHVGHATRSVRQASRPSDD